VVWFLCLFKAIWWNLGVVTNEPLVGT
jgi:hypothetical protein